MCYTSDIAGMKPPKNSKDDAKPNVYFEDLDMDIYTLHEVDDNDRAFFKHCKHYYQ
jgi:hypothetical protein